MEKTTSTFTVHLIRIVRLLSGLLESNTALYHPLNSYHSSFLYVVILSHSHLLVSVLLHLSWCVQQIIIIIINNNTSMM